MPADQQEYVRHWHEVMPDFEIKIWHEEDFRPYLDNSIFVRDTIANGKYGFFSDYFRLVVLYNFGGIYMDTDIEIHKPLNEFLNHKMFMGFIFDSSIGTATIGTEAHNPIMKEWLQQLEENYERTRKLTISNDWATKYFIDNFPTFRLNGKRQSLPDGLELYPKDYFERYHYETNSDGGYAEHHCAGSWDDVRRSSSFKNLIKRLLGRKWTSILGHWAFLPHTPYYHVYKQHRMQ